MSDLRTAARMVLEAYDTHDPLTIVMEDLRAALDKHDQSRVWIEERKAQLAKDRELAQRNASEESERIRQANEEGRCWACGKTKVDSEPIAKLPPEAEAATNHDYERGFVDGMSEQARRSVDRAINATAEPIMKPEITSDKSIPPEAQTEAEKIAYCAGWWDALAKKREQK